MLLFRDEILLRRGHTMAAENTLVDKTITRTEITFESLLLYFGTQRSHEKHVLCFLFRNTTVQDAPGAENTRCNTNK